METKNERAVIVFNDNGDIFFGFTTDQNRKEMTLVRVRQIVRYSGSNKGILGCAFRGPDQNCRISPEIKEVWISNVRQVIVCNMNNEIMNAWNKDYWA